jgi:hypothetical protein
MDIKGVRKLINEDRIILEFSLHHALVEARKDGLTQEDLVETVMTGEVIEDYGERVLLLNFMTNRNIPLHIVLEFFEGDSIATIVTAYIPSAARWEQNRKTRKKTKGSIKKRKR